MWVGICDEGLGVCVCEREKGEENTYLGGGDVSVWFGREFGGGGGASYLSTLVAELF